MTQIMEQECINALTTPFGSIIVRLNGQQISFQYRKEVDGREGYETEQKPIIVHHIDVDLNSCKVGDLITIFFNDDILSFFCSDEKSIVYYSENKKIILGFQAYDPEDYRHLIRNHCYEMVDDYNPKGVTYQVLYPPYKYGRQYRHAKTASVLVAWISKSEYNDPIEALDSVL